MSDIRWTVDDQYYPDEPGPEVKAQVQGWLAEWVKSGDPQLIEKCRRVCSLSGHEWFEAMYADAKIARTKEEMKSQGVQSVLASAGQSAANLVATGVSPLARAGIAEGATSPQGTPSPSATAEVSPFKLRRRLWGLPADPLKAIAAKAVKLADVGAALEAERLAAETPPPAPFFCAEPRPTVDCNEDIEPEDVSAEIEDEPEVPFSRVRPEDTGQPALLSHTTPLDTAKAYARRFCWREGSLACYHWQDEFWEWNGKHYEAVPEDIMWDRMVKFLAQSKKLEAGKPNFKPRSQYVTEALGMLKSSVRLLQKYQPPMWLDTGRRAGELLAFRNGLVNVRTGKRLAPTPRLWIHGAADYDWDPDVPCERWKSFLEEGFPGDKESQDFIEEWLGYCMTEDTRFQKGALFIGKPRSGKGTVAWVLEQLVGSASFVALSFGDWLSHANSKEDLIGKRVGCFPDVRLKPPKQYGSSGFDPGGLPHGSVQLLLQIIGGDAVTIGRKYKEAWRGRLPTKLTLISNEVPNFNDPVLATRFVKVLFGVSFLGREDPDLQAKLGRELPGIAARCLAAYRRLRDRGRFVQPASAVVLDRRIAEAGNPRYVPDPAGFVEVSHMRLRLETWCRHRDRPDVLKSIPEQHTLRHVNAVPGFEGVIKHRPRGPKGQVRGYLGLRLRTQEEKAAMDDESQWHGG
jgi:putative DNA primase/helicase